MKAPHMHPFVQLIKEDIPMVFGSLHGISAIYGAAPWR